MKKLKVLSLFDGISGAKVALERLGYKSEYYASEIDKYAIQISKKNYSDIIQVGDIKKLDASNCPDFDLLIGGSPCQDLSIAGKGQGLDGERSGLFYEYLRILKELKPKYFLLENVASMKKEVKRIISEALEVEPILINSALVSAQQRKRLYWTNIQNVDQPNDCKIYLKDILESGDVDRLKAYCIDSSYFKGTSQDIYFNRKRRQAVFEKPEKLGHLHKKPTQSGNIYGINAKSVTLSANGGGMGAKTGLYFCAAQRGRYINGTKKTEQKLEIRDDQKTNTLTTVQKDNYVLNVDDFVIRKLTPMECERLQTFPDNYSDCVSNTQRYKALGNGFTVDVIAHILSFAKF